jgi:2-desacetyl-2-hydroxyethyl bacteriochlorophyllide A dehydrogenase
MRAAVLVKPGFFELRDVDEPVVPGSGEVLVRIRRVGICGTDIHAYQGSQPFMRYPRILGHELAVEVLEVGPGVTGVKPGDRAAVRPAIGCGSCDACRRGFENACDTLAVLGAHVDGGMRERLLVPETALHPSTSLTLDELALVEPLSIGGHAVSRGSPMPGDRALVIGAGPIGLAITAHLVEGGLQPWLVDVSEERRAFASAWSSVDVLDPGTDAVAAVRQAMAGELANLVFDATGNPASMRAAFGLVASGGRLVLVGLFEGDLAFHDPEFHRRELTVTASRNATAEDFRRSIEVIDSGGTAVTAWITHRTTLDALPEMFMTLQESGSRVIKAIVDM